MNKLTISILKVMRKLYLKIFNDHLKTLPICDQDPDSVSKTIYDAILSDKPCMIARFGSTEMSCISNYVGIKNSKNEIVKYIKGKTNSWWWEPKTINQMQQWSGFFPPSIEKIEQFCEIMINDIHEVNILGSWLPEENLFEKELINADKVRFILLDPFWSKKPWTMALKGKKVLVVHPFSETIELQYKKRELLFQTDLLPEFELMTVKAIQSIAGTETPFKDWFEALEYMKSEIDKHDYDVCLIGAGAYGFPLAAHVKRQGKKGFQLGGSLQLIFGILGKRWENPNYASGAELNYKTLFNENWVRPSENEKPKNSEIVESNCYW